MKSDECKPPKPDKAWALFLDVDGTLIDIAETPSMVAVPAELPQLLAALGRALDGALALVSGRTLSDLDGLFAPLALPAAGQHGAEMRLADGSIEKCSIRSPELIRLLARITEFAADRPGILVEDKGLSIAVHYRLAPQYRGDLQRLIATELASSRNALETMAGRCVFEVKSRNVSKRTAVEYFMRTAPFLGRLPVVLGDDRTDEDGFAAALARGGHAVRVGTGNATLADWRLASPAAARAWLSGIADILNGT